MTDRSNSGPIEPPPDAGAHGSSSVFAPRRTESMATSARSSAGDLGRPTADPESSLPPGHRPDPGPPGAGVQPVRQPGSGLGLIVSFVIAAVVLVLAFYVAGDARPGRVPLVQRTTPLFCLIAAAAVAIAVAGALYAERTAARAARSLGRTYIDGGIATAWIMPALATGAAVLLVATYHNTAMLAIGPIVAFVGNAGALFARDLLEDAADASQRTAAIIHALMIHAVAFFALGVVYLNKMPISIGAPIVGVVGALLTLEALERGTAEHVTRLVYAALAGGALALVMVALDWWQTNGWTGGAVLLVCFYLASGVLLARTQRSILRGRDMVEFGAVSLAAFLILAVTA